MLMFLSGLGCGLLGALVIVGRPAVKDGYRVVSDDHYRFLVSKWNDAAGQARRLRREADAIFAELREVIDKWQPDQKEV